MFEIKNVLVSEPLIYMLNLDADLLIILQWHA
jgi:hypothetical protein